MAPNKRFESAWPHPNEENEGKRLAEARLHDKYDKLEHPEFAEGKDRLLVHKASGRVFRSRIEVVAKDKVCPTCSAQHLHVNSPFLAPIRVSVVECDEDGTPHRNADGSLKVVALLTHMVASANVPDPDHWRGIKRLVRNSVLEALSKREVHETMFTENLGEGVAFEDLATEAQRQSPNAALVAELEHVRANYRAAGEEANRTLNELREQLAATDALLGQAQQRIKDLEAEVLALKTPKEEPDAT